MASKALWNCEDKQIWLESLVNYKRAADSTKISLRELERWYFQDLPGAVQERSPPHLTKDELVKLVEWKLLRGKWRPKLLDYAKQQKESVVEQATAQSFELLESCKPNDLVSLRLALDVLTELKGVGPATASAMLAIVCEHAPFMSDEALEACLKSREYTAKSYIALVQALQAKANKLGSHLEGPWTAVSVERALWAVSVLGMPCSNQIQDSNEQKGTKKCRVLPGIKDVQEDPIRKRTRR